VRECSFCGNPAMQLFRGGQCFECAEGDNRIVVTPGPVDARTPEMRAFDLSRAMDRAGERRTELANEQMARAKKTSGTSLQEYFRVGELLKGDGRAAASALGLVHYKTSDTPVKLGRVTIEIDPLQARAQRLRKSVITGARLHDQEAQKGSFRGAWYFLTLTYRNGGDSGPRDISELLKRMRGHFNRARDRRARWNREVFRYVWVGELTKRLRVHYHVMIWIPTGMFFGRVDHRGWWPHGWSNIEKARNCVGYLAKYASKFTSVIAGAFPKGFRTSGVGGLNVESKRELRWWKAPKEAREVLGGDADIRKTKGGWFDRLTGVFWPSPWKVTFAFGRTIAWKVVPL
jgi:hypothetical protein